MITTKIYGERELNDVLRHLPQAVSKRLTIAGMRKAAKPMKDVARNLAPKRSGTTKKAITIIATKRRTDKPEIWIAPTHGKNVQYDAWYSRFHELGTKGFGERTRSKGVTVAYARKSRIEGRTGLPAIHFMQRAYDSKLTEVRGRISDEISAKTVTYLRKKVPKFYAR